MDAIEVSLRYIIKYDTVSDDFIGEGQKRMFFITQNI